MLQFRWLFFKKKKNLLFYLFIYLSSNKKERKKRKKEGKKKEKEKICHLLGIFLQESKRGLNLNQLQKRRHKEKYK